MTLTYPLTILASANSPVFVLALFLAALLPSPATAQQWENLTQPPNDSWFIHGLYQIESTLFTKRFDKLYRSQDDGDTWTYNHALIYSEFSWVEVNREKNFLYVAGESIDSSGLPALYETKNLGDTWTYLGTTPGLQWFFIGDTIYTYENEKMFRRLGTNAWQEIPSWPKADVTFISEVRAIGQHIYALTWKGIYHSPDAGYTWELVLDEDFIQTSTLQFMELEVLGEQVLARVSFPGRIYMTDTSSGVWQTFQSSGQGLFSNGKNIFSIDSSGFRYLLRYNDSPELWDSIPLYAGQNIELRGVSELLDGTNLIGTVQFGLARKTPGAALWTPIGNEQLGYSPYSLQYFEGQLFHATPNLQSVSPDDGISWKQRLNTVEPISGQTWNNGNYHYIWHEVSYDGPGVIYRCPRNQRFEWTLYRVLPGFTSGVAATGDTLLSLVKEDFSPNISLYQSLDDGLSWNLLVSNFGKRPIRGWQESFYLLRDSALFRSFDAGVSWQKLHSFTHPVNENVSAFFVVNDTFLVSYRPADRIYYSADGGLTFNQLPAPTNSNTSQYALRLDGHTLMLSMNDGPIYLSRDLGLSWLTFNPPPGYDFYSNFGNCSASENTIFLYNSAGDHYRLRFDGQKQVAGKVFMDVNGNGLKETGEPGLNDMVVDAAQSNTIGITYNDGDFALLVAPDVPDTLTVKTVSPHYAIVPPQQIISPGSNPVALFALQPIGLVTDDAVQLVAAGSFRAGYKTVLHTRVDNIGTIPANGQLKLVLPEILSMVSAMPSPDIQNGDTLVWYYDNLLPLNSRYFKIVAKTDIVPPGTPVNITAQVVAAGDADTTNNTEILSAEVVSSYDPNDKTVSETQLPVDISEGRELVYTIRFQNLGNVATDFVTVRDTLSDALDPASVRILLASHPFEWSIEEGRILVFRFNPISLSPAASDSLLSQGFVQFAAALRPGLEVGEQIANTAHIYFDFNPAVVTNTVITSIAVVATFEPSQRELPLDVFPNPASSRFTLRLPNDVAGTGRVEIFSAEGRMIYSAATQGNTQNVELQDVAAGAYWCRWMLSGKVFWGKVIVQK